MFDTAIFRQLTRLPSSDQLRECGFLRVRGNSVGERWAKNVDVNDFCVLRLSWYKVYTDAYLSAEISLPKFLHGNNVEMITQDEVADVLEKLSNLVTYHTGVEFDAGSSRVARLDVCYNWRTSQADVCARLKSLQTAHVPRMMCRTLESNGATIYFRNCGKKKSEEILLYAKHTETAKLKPKVRDDVLRASVGVFRLEHRYFRGTIMRNFGTNRADKLLCAALAEKVINSDLKTLTLDKEIQIDDRRFEILYEYCDGNMALFRQLTSLLVLCDEYGVETVVAREFFGKSRFYELRKALKSAGLWLCTPSKQALKALSPPNFKANENVFVPRCKTYYPFHPVGIINQELSINP
jgi:hypothetical protein